MITNNWIQILGTCIEATGTLITYLIVFHGRFRVSPFVVTGCFIALCAIEIILYHVTSWAANVPIFFFQLGAFYLFIRERRVMNFTVYCFLLILVNCLGSLAHGGVYALMTAINGSAEWLVQDQAGVAFRIIALGLMIPAYVLACYLTLKLKPIIMNAGRKLQTVLVATVTLPYVVGNVIKVFLLDLKDYSNDPDGIGLFIDTVRIVVFFAVTGVLIAKATKSAGKKTGLNSEQQDQGQETYRNAAEELLRRRHDSANWALAGLDSDVALASGEINHLESGENRQSQAREETK